MPTTQTGLVCGDVQESGEFCCVAFGTGQWGLVESLQPELYIHDSDSMRWCVLVLWLWSDGRSITGLGLACQVGFH